MTSVNPAAAVPVPTQATGTPSTANPLQSLSDPNTFLKLLVAQLKYQDPLNPMSGTQFMTQTAQLTEVETMTNLASQATNQLAAQQTMASTSMIGKQITATLADGSTISGQVQGVTLDATNGPTLFVNGKSVPLGDVKTVGTTA